MKDSAKKPLVVLLTTPDAPIHEEAKRILREVADVRPVWSKGWVVDDEMVKAVREASAIIVRVGMVTSKVIEACKDLKIVAVHGVGADRVDIEAATKREIIVTNVPLANIDSVAEHTFGLILSILKKIPMLSTLVKEGKWVQSRSIGNGKEILNHTIGVVGLGHVGKKVAKIAAAFGMTILAYDPYIMKEKAEELGARLVEFNTLLKNSDVITIHVPLTQETHHLIGKNELGLMKRTAVIVNTSRGGIIDETALYIALKENRITGAALDVTEKEPLDPNNPLSKLDNVIITPHVAGSSEESVFKMSVTAADGIANYFKGATPNFVINKEVLRKIK